jgi:hypothetical protein
MASNSATLAIATRMFQAEVAGKSGVTQTASVGVSLKRTGAILHCVSTGQVIVGLKLVTGIIRSDGSGVFHFQGYPNRAVEWTLASGSGNLTPYSSTTDGSGRAWAKYDAGGYVGEITVQVVYGR